MSDTIVSGPAPRASISKWVVVSLLVITVLFMVRVRYIGTPGNDWRSAINSDGKGYYEYVRMVLFRSGPGIHPGKGILHPAIDAQVIDHFSGAAVAMAPFAFVAHGYTLTNRGKPEDGYSLHYQVSVGLAALCWLGLGLWALRRFLLDIGVADGTVAITLVFITLGTGLIVQAVVHPAMSHVYGFASIALLFHRTRRFLRVPDASHLIMCSALLGLAILIRPVNALVVLALPMAAMGLSVERLTVQQVILSRSGALALVVLVGVLGIQGVSWYLQSGQFIVRPYPQEGFHWDRPRIMDSLFSARNGLFFYWPLLVLVVPGIWGMWRYHAREVITIVLFIVPFMYVTACWWNWAYGDNFGQRTYLDMLAVLAVPIAFAIPRERVPRHLLVVVGLLLCSLNLFQGWQYKNHLLITGQIDMVRYRHVFLETDPEQVKLVGGFAELPLFAPDGYEPVPAAMFLPSAPAGASPWRDLILSPVEPSSIGKPMYVQVDLTRSRSSEEPPPDVWILLALRRQGEFRIAHRFRMDLVPDRTNRSRSWHYAFNMWQHEVGDTLVVMGTNEPGYRVERIALDLSVPR